MSYFIFCHLYLSSFRNRINNYSFTKPSYIVYGRGTQGRSVKSCYLFTLFDFHNRIVVERMSHGYDIDFCSEMSFFLTLLQSY